MGDRCTVNVTIGGPISADALTGLRDLLDREPVTFSNIEEVIDGSSDEEHILIDQDEVNYGTWNSLTDLLVRFQLHARVHTGPGYEYGPAVTIYRPGADPVAYTADHDGNPTIGLATMAATLERGPAAIALLLAESKVDLAPLPPIELPPDAAEEVGTYAVTFSRKRWETLKVKIEARSAMHARQLAEEMLEEGDPDGEWIGGYAGDATIIDNIEPL
jgi:hypothetical protein